MSRKLKVYGCNSFKFGGKQKRVVAAVSNQREFADLCETSLHYIRGFASETGNPDEISAAMAQPHTLVLSPTAVPGYTAPWFRPGYVAPVLPETTKNIKNIGEKARSGS